MLILVHYHLKGEHYHIKGDDKGLAEGPLQAQPSKLGEPYFLCFIYFITTVLRWSVPTSIQKYQTTMWKTFLCLGYFLQINAKKHNMAKYRS